MQSKSNGNFSVDTFQHFAYMSSNPKYKQIIDNIINPVKESEQLNQSNKVVLDYSFINKF